MADRPSDRHYVAIREDEYLRRDAEADFFFNRPSQKFSHCFTYDYIRYVVFGFPCAEEAKQFAKAFHGEPFDPRDAGRGSKWMFWYKGRAAKRDRNRDPYDFSDKR